MNVNFKQKFASMTALNMEVFNDTQSQKPWITIRLIFDTQNYNITRLIIVHENVWYLYRSRKINNVLNVLDL